MGYTLLSILKFCRCLDNNTGFAPTIDRALYYSPWAYYMAMSNHLRLNNDTSFLLAKAADTNMTVDEALQEIVMDSKEYVSLWVAGGCDGSAWLHCPAFLPRYVYIYICIYVYNLCIYIYIYIYTYTHTHTHTHIYIYMCSLAGIAHIKRFWPR